MNNAQGIEEVSDMWIPICTFDEMVDGVGICALMGNFAEEETIALFRVRGDEVFVISNVDPFSGASILSRGIVGDRGGVLKVASPMYKQNFCLKTGQCLDDPEVRVPTFACRVNQGMVEVLG